MKRSKNYDSPFGRLNDNLEIDEYESSIFEQPEGIVDTEIKKSSTDTEKKINIHKDFDKLVD